MTYFTRALSAVDPALVTPISKEAARVVEPVSSTSGIELGTVMRGKIKSAMSDVWSQPEAYELRAMLSEIAHKSGYAARLKAVAPREAYKRAAKAANLSGEYSSAWGTYKVVR